MLCDAELAAQRPDDALTGVLDPAAGTARHVLLAIAADDRTAHMRPLLVSGRGLRCAARRTPRSCWRRCVAAAEERFTLPEWEAEPGRPADLAALLRRGVDAARLGRARHASC